MIGQHDKNHHTALDLDYFGSNHQRRFVPGLAGKSPILALKKTTECNVDLEMIGWKVNPHPGKIALPKGKKVPFVIVNVLPEVRMAASARAVSSLAGRMWDTTFPLPVEKYFVVRLWQMTGFHVVREVCYVNELVEPDPKRHRDVGWWEWALQRNVT